MGMEVIGRLHVIGETQQKSERFTKREFVLEIAENPKYPQTVQFQLTGDRVNQIDGMNVGDQIGKFPDRHGIVADIGRDDVGGQFDQHVAVSSRCFGDIHLYRVPT